MSEDEGLTLQSDDEVSVREAPRAWCILCDRTGVRMVDLASLAYRSARKFQIRLTTSDLQDKETLAALAAQTKLSTKEFIARFGYLVNMAPRPY